MGLADWSESGLAPAGSGERLEKGNVMITQASGVHGVGRRRRIGVRLAATAGMVLGASMGVGALAAPAALAVATAPSITQPTSADATTTQKPAISGTGVTSGDAIDVTFQVGGGTQSTACTTMVDAAGNFTCTPKGPLPTGPVTLVAMETVVGAMVSSPSVTVTVGMSAAITSPVAGSTTATQTPTILGSGQPLDLVKITDAKGATICATATIGSDGKFSCSPTTPLALGALSLIATETNPNGTNPTASPPVSVTIGAAPPPTTTPGAAAAGTPAAATTPAAASGTPAAVASGSGGTVAQHGVPVPLVAGLTAGGLALLVVAWRRRQHG